MQNDTKGRNLELELSLMIESSFADTPVYPHPLDYMNI